jgi:hypothetical protein
LHVTGTRRPYSTETALINELYLRLSDLKPIDWRNRAHFFALCARQMRRILTDQARARQSHKRGDGANAISLDDALVISPEPSADLVAVDDALNQLAKVDDRKSSDVPGAMLRGENVSLIFRRKLFPRFVIDQAPFAKWFSICARDTACTMGLKFSTPGPLGIRLGVRFGFEQVRDAFSCRLDPFLQPARLCWRPPAFLETGSQQPV